MKKPRAKPCKVTTTPFPNKPLSSEARLRDLAAALDAQRVRIDGIESRLAAQERARTLIATVDLGNGDRMHYDVGIMLHGLLQDQARRNARQPWYARLAWWRRAP